MPPTFQDKFAIVTGGSRGIGRGIALELAKNGAAGVAITYQSNTAAASEVLTQIKSHGALACAIQADVLDEHVGPKIVREALEGLQTPHINILVNSAARSGAATNFPFAAETLSTFTAMMQANVYTPLSTIRAVLPVMPRQGRIINISSTAGKDACTDPIITYATSKAALESLTRCLGKQFGAEKGITINSVSVGPTETDSLDPDLLPGDLLDRLKAMATAEKRFGTVDDVAQIVVFLASESARWINGNSIPANGGGVLAAEG